MLYSLSLHLTRFLCFAGIIKFHKCFSVFFFTRIYFFSQFALHYKDVKDNVFYIFFLHYNSLYFSLYLIEYLQILCCPIASCSWIVCCHKDAFNTQGIHYNAIFYINNINLSRLYIFVYLYRHEISVSVILHEVVYTYLLITN